MVSTFLNGAFALSTPEAGAAAPAVAVSAFDAGLLHGVGLFETMSAGVVGRGDAARAWCLHLDEHLERLEGSARQLGLSNSLRTAPLGDAVLETVRRGGLAAARVRLTITGGDLNLLAASRGAGGGGHDPTILIVAQPATTYPAEMFSRGVTVTVADTRVSPLDSTAGHKTLNYWWRLRELQAAAGRQAAESLVFSVTNHLVSGCVSNVLIVKNGRLHTPICRGEEDEIAKASPGPGATLRSPALPGVTRRWAIDTAAGLGVLCTRRMLTISDVLEADEVMLTNSSWGVLPVVRAEAAPIAAGVPGKVTLELAGAWARAIKDAASLA